MDLFWIIAAIIICIALGLVFLYAFMRWLQREEDGEDYETRVTSSRTVRGHQRTRLLESIGKPEEEITTELGNKAHALSARQRELWADYKRLEAEDKELMRAEDEKRIRLGR